MLASLVLVLAGCSRAYDYPEYTTGDRADKEPRLTTAMVTVLPDGAGGFYFKLGGEKLKPRGYTPSVHGRAMCELLIYPNEGSGDEYKLADVRWFEPIDEGSFTYNASAPGADGIDVDVSSWVTEACDGYLTIYYSTWWGEHPVHHDFYLVAGLDPADPYSLELRQDSHSDDHFERSDGIICFDINTLPQTDGRQTLTLNWTRTDGRRSAAKFEFETFK